MNHINDLRGSLAQLFRNLEAGDMDVKVAKEMNNTANRIINTAKLELKSRELCRNTEELPFLSSAIY
jgi:hypothetical protein